MSVSDQKSLANQAIDEATRSLVEASELFDADWYLENYPDARTWESPLDHYLIEGWKRGCDPGPGFSTKAYLEANPDVAEAGLNPLFHWIRQGKQEGREIKPSRLATGRDPAVKHAENGPGLVPASETFDRVVLVYQMAKVGSRSVEAAIREVFSKALLEDPIFHTHTLAGLEKLEQHREQAERRYANPADALNSLRNHERIKAVLESKPSASIDIVTLVRDPIARAVSMFFHKLDWYLPTWQDQYGKGVLQIEDLIELFLERERPWPWEEDWFEVELKPTFGIDVYQEPFDHKRGWQAYERNDGKVRCLLIRTEDLNSRGKAALEQFFGMPFGNIEAVNTGAARPQGALYVRFRESGLPNDFVDRCYATKLAQHFYTKDELNSFRRRWVKKGNV
jgi:hypothetical protein